MPLPVQQVDTWTIVYWRVVRISLAKRLDRAMHQWMVRSLSWEVAKIGSGSSPSKQRGQTMTIEISRRNTRDCKDNESREVASFHSPIKFFFDLVQILPALLTEIFVRTC